MSFSVEEFGWRNRYFLIKLILQDRPIALGNICKRIRLNLFILNLRDFQFVQKVSEIKKKTGEILIGRSLAVLHATTAR
jgi:hypothetical protein